MTEETLADRLENHVRSRLPGTIPALVNGAWTMMLEASAEIRRLEGLSVEDHLRAARDKNLESARAMLVKAGVPEEHWRT